MAEPFLAEVRIMSFNFPPKGWAFCNGQLLPINQNQALFSLLGTTYGGNGQVNFALPNLQGRVPVHIGPGFNQGMASGETAHTVTEVEMTQHTHLASASGSPATAVIPSSSLVLAQSAFEIYRPASSFAALIPGTVTNVGGSQAHSNMQPYLTLNFCIALQGIFPSRS